MSKRDEEHWIDRVDPATFNKMVERAGLSHLLDRPDELREEVLRRLGMTHLRDDPEAMMRATFQKINENWARLREVKRDVGAHVLKAYKISSN